jgi:hypothetical protein
MFVCYADWVVHIVKELEWLEASHRNGQPWSGTDLEIRTEMILFQLAQPVIIACELDAPLNRLTKIMAVLKGNLQDSTFDLAGEIKLLRELITSGLRDRFSLIMKPDRYKYYGNKEWFGSALHKAFEAASPDMMAAANCYALEEPTACVFHSMRVAERGMRALARHLRVSVSAKKPIEYEDWGTVIKALRKKLEELQGQPNGPKKDERLRQHSGLADQCAYFNNLWRKDVSHARKMYLTSEALTALTRTREFMQRLADVLRRR